MTVPTTDPGGGGILPPDVIHELRTPLNQIIGYSELLVEQAHEEGQDGFVPDLNKILSAGQQLLSIINHRLAPRSDVAPDTPLQRPASSGAPDVDTPADVACLAVRNVERAADTPAAPPDSQGLLLVVDDNEMNRDVLSRRLEKQGYRVALAENGREALEVVRTQPFELVLLDIMMPEMDGYETLRCFKADETLRHIPVIVISALNEMESVVRCIELGAEDYL
ncbi:MAG: response regulator, partial [Chloroflexi bacterium]|nr:response regulator [Chloroflexota bacterium]